VCHRKYIDSSYLLEIGSGVLSFLSSAASIFGPKGQAVGAVGNLAASVLSEVAGSFSQEKMKVLGFCNFTDDLEFKFDDLKGATIDVEKSKIMALITNANNSIITPENKINMDKLRIDLETKPVAILAEIVKKLQEELNTLTTTIMNPIDNAIAAVQDKFTSTITDIGKDVWGKIDTDNVQGPELTTTIAKNKQNEKNIKTLEKAMSGINACSTFVGIVSKSYQSSIKIKKINADEELFQEASKEVIKFINGTFQKLINGMKSMDNSFSEANSRSVLDFLRYNMKKSIKQVVDYFKTVFDEYDFDDKKDLYRSFEDFDSLSETIATIYGRIFEGMNDLKLAKLITAVKMNVRDDCRLRFTEMEKFTAAILISKDGQNILHTSNQLFFPCSVDYNTEYTKVFKHPTISSSTTSSSSTIAEEASSLVETVISNIKILRDKAEIAKFGIDKHSSYLITKNIFNTIEKNSNSNSCGSFFIYRNADKILRLLKGETILVFADITAKDPSYSTNAEGVKFITVNVALKFDNNNTNKLLQEKLKLFAVSMVSSGFYDYKFNDQVYRLKNCIIKPSSFYGTGEKIGKNTDYKNIKDAAPLFSPYTKWEIQLSKISDDNDFSALEQFINPNLLVNSELHIIGSASYLDRNKNNTNGHRQLYDDIKVSEYYTEFKVDQKDKVQWC